ncbi:hypothetical protein ACFW4G_28035 [Paenibacillus lactis]|uniref:hypothetical protein n=1 Tax=Paenibacillus TaxID=44249 RepID=UPI0011A0CA35|nr:hypothetical protein [Paenibacillus sp. IHBB 10380]
MNKEILASKNAGGIQYQIYRKKITYLADYDDYRGNAFQQEVIINAYGITALLMIGQETLKYDSGPLSAQNYEVNSLFHLLTRLDLCSVDEIRETVWAEYVIWCRNPYRNPFSRKANQVLRLQMRRQL